MKKLLVGLVSIAVLAGLGWVVWTEKGPGRRGLEPGGPPSGLRRFDSDRVVRDPELGVEVVDDELVVTLAPGVTETAFQSQLDGRGTRGVRIVGRIPELRMLQLQVPGSLRHELLEELEHDRMLESAGQNFVFHALDTFDDPALGPGKEEDWGLDRIGAPEAWRITKGGVIVGVVDSGVRLDHEELSGKLIAPYSYATRSAVMQHGHYNPADPLAWVAGHGTHVAATIAAKGGNGRGTVGVAPDAKIVAVQALYLAGNGKHSGSMLEIVEGIRRTIDAGALVVNLSLGLEVEEADMLAYQGGNEASRRAVDAKWTRIAAQSYASYKSIVEYADRRGTILVKASGNDGVPARWDGLCASGRAIGVASVDAQDRRSIFRHSPAGAEFSSGYGPGTTVSAPGSRIWSGFSNPDRPYAYMSGTSMAAPHVAGVVALLKSVAPGLTVGEVRDILVSTGTPIITDLPIGPIVDAPAALAELERRMTAGGPQPAPQPRPLPPGVSPQPTPQLPGVKPRPPQPAPVLPVPPEGRPDLPTPGPEAPPDRVEPPPPGSDIGSDVILPEEVDPQPSDFDDDMDPTVGEALPPPMPPDVDIPDPGTLPPDFDDPIWQPEPAPGTRPDPGTAPQPAEPTPVPVPAEPRPPTYEEMLTGPTPWKHDAVRRKIDEWLRGATPVEGGRYNEWGVIVDLPNVTVTVRTKPDWASYKYEYLWNEARTYKSRNLGTLYEYLHGLPFSRFEPPAAATPAPAPAGAGKIGAATPRALWEAIKRADAAGEFIALLRTHSAFEQAQVDQLKKAAIEKVRSNPKAAAQMKEFGYASIDAFEREDIWVWIDKITRTRLPHLATSRFVGAKPRDGTNVVLMQIHGRLDGQTKTHGVKASRIDGKWFLGGRVRMRR